MKKILVAILLLFVALTFIGCDSDGQKNPTDYVLETESYIELNIYDEERVIYVKSTNPNERVRFVCESDVLAIEEDGRILPNKMGEATVQIICGNLEKTCIVKVLETDEVPVISLYGINDGKMNLVKDYVFPLNYSVCMGGKDVAGSFEFSSMDESVVSVSNDGVLTAKKEGEADITVKCAYKIYNEEYTLKVNVCKDLVVKLSKNRLMLNYGDNERVDFIGVYEDGNEVVGAAVTWVSTDNNIATVDDGLIKAVNYGKTYVKAIYNVEDKQYVGYVLVSVSEKQLEAPANFNFNETNGKLEWDGVEGASGYCIYDGTDKVRVNTTYVRLGEFEMSDVYFGDQKFTIYAYSDDEQIKDSAKSTCFGHFSSINYTDKIVKKDVYEADITESDNQDFEADTTVYYAECTSTSLPGRSDVYGYLFKKVYFTNTCLNTYGPNGAYGKWCNFSLMNPAFEQSFYDSKITFWAYAEQKTDVCYVKMDQMWARTMINKQTLEPYKWTQVSFAVSSNDFPYLTMIAATDNFYFIDFRISELTYETKDYSDVYKGDERVAEVKTAIENLPGITDSVACGNAIKSARNLYNGLTDRMKEQVNNYETLTQKETEFGNAVYNADYNSVKSDSAYIAIENKIKEEYSNIYEGITINNLKYFENKAEEITTVINALDSRCYYGLTVKSETYKNYVELRKDYSIIEDTRGTVGRRIIASSYSQTGGSGFVEINGVDTAGNQTIKGLLNHPTYGYCLTMGTNPRVDTAIRFKNKDNLSLDGYTHILFAVKNPRDEKMGVYLYGSSGRVKTLAENVKKAGNHGEYTIIEMTVEEFMTYDISFGYDMRPAEQGNIWLTRFVAIKKDARVQEIIDDIANFVRDFPSVTLENYLDLYENIEMIDAKINALPTTQKARISGYDKYKGIKSSYTVVYDMVGADLYNKILVDGGGLDTFLNGETHASPSVFKPMCLNEPYGYCARVKIGGGNGLIRFRPTDKFKATLDLSAYTHVLIGVKSETNTCTYNWSDGTSPHVLATSTNTTDFITLRLTVDEFLKGYIYVISSFNSIWFTPIVAIYDPADVITEINDYLTALGDNSITLENYKTYLDAATSINAKLVNVNKDCNVFITNLSEYNAKKFTLVDNTEGSDLDTRFTITGDKLNKFTNGETQPAIAEEVTHDPYGKCARIVVQNGYDPILKVEYNLTPDLSDYNYVLIGLYSEIGTATWHWKGADGKTYVASAKMVEEKCQFMKISVEDFLGGYLVSENCDNADRYWITPIIAVIE